MMTFKHFFLQSFKATKAPPRASKRSISAKLRSKILDRIKLKRHQVSSGIRMSGPTR